MKLLFVALVIIGYYGISECLPHGSTTKQISSDAVKRSPLRLPEAAAPVVSKSALNVSCLFFSGLPDPYWLVTSDHASYEKITTMLDAAKKKELIYTKDQTPAKLGYKGFYIQMIDSEVIDLVVGDDTLGLQRLLFTSMPDGTMGQKVITMISNAIKNGGIKPSKKDEVSGGKARVSKRWAPEAYGWITRNIWNDFRTKSGNNCYNYANDKVTNTFAQPGRGSLALYAALTANLVEAAAVSDNLAIMVPQPVAGPVGMAAIPVPANLHMVALVVDPGIDYHWYRLDANGVWSHKPGPTAISNTDGAGVAISDPRNAANSPTGPNYAFVSFMHSDKAAVTII